MAESIRNIELIGTSVNVLTFDPLISADSKKRRGHPVIDLQKKKMTADERYLIPVGSEFISGGYSELSSRTSRIFSGYDWQRTFKDSFRATMGMEGMFEFSSSASFGQFREQIASTEEMQTFTRGEYVLFSVQLNLDDQQERLQIHHRFRDRVAELNPDDFSSFQAFVKEFGTHFTSRVDFGATHHQIIRIKKGTYENKVRANVDIEAEAKATFWGAQAGAGYGFAKETGAGFKNEAGVEVSDLVWNGGVPKQKWDEWVDTVVENPAMVGCDLQELSVLFTPDFFPDDPQIGAKRDQLTRAIANYIVNEGTDVSAELIRYGAPVCIKHKRTGQVLTAVAGKPELQLSSPAGSLQQQWVLRPVSSKHTDPFLRTASMILVQSVAEEKYLYPRHGAPDVEPVPYPSLWAPEGSRGWNLLPWLVGTHWQWSPKKEAPQGPPVIAGQDINLRDPRARGAGTYIQPASAPRRLANCDGQVRLDEAGDEVVWVIEPVKEMAEHH